MKKKPLFSFLLAGSAVFFTLQSCEEAQEINKLQEVSTDTLTYQVETIAGSSATGDADGKSSSAKFRKIIHMDECPSSGLLYVNDLGKVRQITTKGVVSSIAELSLQYPEEEGGITVTPNGVIYVGADNRVFKVTSKGQISVFADPSGDGEDEGLPLPIDDITSGPDGSLYIIHDWNDIRKITTPGAVITNYADIGKSWGGITMGPDNLLYIVGNRQYVFKITSSGEEVTVYTAQQGNIPLYLTDIEVATDGTIYISEEDKIHRVSPDGKVSIIFLKDDNDNQFWVNDIVLTNNDKTLYLAGALRIGKIDLEKMD